MNTLNKEDLEQLAHLRNLAAFVTREVRNKAMSQRLGHYLLTHYREEANGIYRRNDMDIKPLTSQLTLLSCSYE